MFQILPRPGPDTQIQARVILNRGGDRSDIFQHSWRTPRQFSSRVFRSTDLHERFYHCYRHITVNFKRAENVKTGNTDLYNVPVFGLPPNQIAGPSLRYVSKLFNVIFINPAKIMYCWSSFSELRKYEIIVESFLNHTGLHFVVSSSNISCLVSILICVFGIGHKFLALGYKSLEEPHQFALSLLLQ